MTDLSRSLVRQPSDFGYLADGTPNAPTPAMDKPFPRNSNCARDRLSDLLEAAEARLRAAVSSFCEVRRVAHLMGAVDVVGVLDFHTIPQLAALLGDASHPGSVPDLDTAIDTWRADVLTPEKTQ